MSVYRVILVPIFRIWTEYRGILCISPYSVRMRENVDQNNSECVHFLRSVYDDSIHQAANRISPQSFT